jgi:hypothetical protein
MCAAKGQEKVGEGKSIIKKNTFEKCVPLKARKK